MNFSPYSLRRRLPQTHDDRGTTMIELVVAMGMLVVFMGMFTTITLLMTNTTRKVQNINSAVTQANQAFLALDKSVRYASAISAPAVSAAGTWHVEYNTNIVSNGVAKDVCTQLRIANSQLQTRSWAPNGTSYTSGSLTAWRMLSNNVTNGALAASSTSTDRPFVVPSANTAASSAYQQLTVTVVAASENARLPEPNRVSMTFAAVNSTAGASTSICQQLAVDSAS